jgi:pimeloyl-ACP methyl ester carboxylesterase
MSAENDLVILVHGYCGSRRDMRFLEKGLRNLGHETVPVSLPATFGSLDDCLESMRRQLKNIVPAGRGTAFVAHSLGGLVVRSYLETDKPSDVHACIFIATPHGGSKLADIACGIPGFAYVFPATRDMTSRKNRIPAALHSEAPHYHANIGAIAGSANRSVLGRVFLSLRSDGRVEMDSAATGDADDSLTLPFGHHEILFRLPTLLAVDSFLKRGTFSEA